MGLKLPIFRACRAPPRCSRFRPDTTNPEACIPNSTLQNPTLGVPYFNTFFLKGTLILYFFLPGYLEAQYRTIRKLGKKPKDPEADSEKPMRKEAQHPRHHRRRSWFQSGAILGAKARKPVLGSMEVNSHLVPCAILGSTWTLSSHRES